MADHFYGDGQDASYPLHVRQLPVLNGELITPRNGQLPHLDETGAPVPSLIYKTKKRSKKKKKKKKSKMAEEEPENTVVKRIDFVLACKIDEPYLCDDDEVKESHKKREDLRERFEDVLRKQSLELRTEQMGDHMYLLIHAPFVTLCEQAEDIKLEMPLRDVSVM